MIYFSDVFEVALPYGAFIAVLLTYAASSLLHVSTCIHICTTINSKNVHHYELLIRNY